MRRFLLLALVLAPSIASAQGFMQVSGSNASQMSLKSHLVEVVIDNQLATTTVDQVFVNPNGFQVEATYLFPVPEGATMSKLSMWIDGQEQEAEMMEAGKARGIYEEIVRQRKDPALLEFAGAKTFKLRVFPIAPNEEKRVKLSYTEALKADGGIIAYKYGLSTSRFSAVPLAEAKVSVKIVSTVPIKSVLSPTHPIDLARPDDHHATAAWEAARVSPDRDFQLYVAEQAGDFGMNLVAQRDGSDDGYFMMMLAPRVVAKSEALKRDVCFVVDTSMSMADEDRIVQARKALKAGLQTLNPGDRFNVIAFSTEVRLWKQGLVDATEATIKEAGEYADGLRARGATNIQGALEQALAMSPKDPARPYMVLFMTDGAPTIGETDPDKLSNSTTALNTARTRIFTLGVGFDLDVRLLDKLAGENNGLRAYVTPTESLETRMAAFYEKLSAPVLADAKIEIDGAGTEIYDVYPKSLSDVFQGQQIAVFGRFKGSGQRAVKLTGTVNGESKTYSWNADFPAAEKSHDAVPRLWAASKVGHLLDAIRLNGEQDELKKEVIALAREFGIVTPYTSYLVLEDSARTAQAGGSGGGRFAGNPGGRATQRQAANDPERPRDVFERKGIPKVEQAGNAADDPAIFFPDALESDHNESADGERMKGDSGEALAAMPGEGVRGRQPGKYEAMGVGGGSGGVRASREADELKAGKGGESQNVKRIGDKTFYHRNGEWRDADWKADLEVVQVEYLSDDYFKLTKDKPELAKFFAVGAQVSVVFEGKLYTVVLVTPK